MPLKSLKKKNMKITINKFIKSLYGKRRGQRMAITTLVLLAIFVGGCKTPYYTTPIESHTNTSAKDSVALVIKDSVRIIERSRWKDYGPLLLPVSVDGARSHARAWNDTTNMILNLTLEEDPIEEKTKTIWRDKEKLRDTTIYVEVPVPAPAEIKEVEVVPRFWRVTGIIGIIETMLLGFYGFFKLKKTGFISRILKIFKKG